MPSEVVAEAIVTIHAMTDVGKARSHNEDNFVVCPDLSKKKWYLSEESVNLSAKGSLLVVADGMGGANAGEVASEIAVETIKEKFNAFEIEENIEESQVRDYLYQAMMEAHKAILAASRQSTECAGMGTTIVIAWVFPQKVIIGWCGDSRAYLYRKDGGLKLLSKDHSLVWELVEAGRLTPEEADVHPDNNIITQSLGDRDRAPQPEFNSCSLQQADRLLLCSDGLNNMLDHRGIEKIVGTHKSLADVNATLIELANQQGGSDNITVLSLEVLSKHPETKSGYALWLFPGIVLSALLLWLTFFGSSAVAPFKNKPASHPLQESSTVASRPHEQDDALPGILPASESPYSNENEAGPGPGHKVAGVFTYERYRYLDSLVRVRIPTQKDEQSLPSPSADSANSELPHQPDSLFQTGEELRMLIRKYQLGFGPEYSTLAVFDSISANGFPDESVVAEDLSRVEVLLDELKPE